MTRARKLHCYRGGGISSDQEVTAQGDGEFGLRRATGTSSS